MNCNMAMSDISIKRLVKKKLPISCLCSNPGSNSGWVVPTNLDNSTVRVRLAQCKYNMNGWSVSMAWVGGVSV